MKHLGSPLMILPGILLLLAAAPTSAQTAHGTILGSITGPSDAAIPGANVRVTNIGTNISNEVTTGAEGGYAVARLIPGQYRVEVTAVGTLIETDTSSAGKVVGRTAQRNP